MESEVIEAELVLPTYYSFKRIQFHDKYPKGQSRRWKHLKQILAAENYQNYAPDEPNYMNIESPPSLHPCKRICDITGFEVKILPVIKRAGCRQVRLHPEEHAAPYYDPRTKLRYANADVFKLVRSLPNEYVQRYLALRNAAVVLK